MKNPPFLVNNRGENKWQKERKERVRKRQRQEE